MVNGTGHVRTTIYIPLIGLWVRIMVFNATFNNISATQWQSVFLVEQTRVSGENHWPSTSHWHTLSHHSFDKFQTCKTKCQLSYGMFCNLVFWNLVNQDSFKYNESFDYLCFKLSYCQN